MLIGPVSLKSAAMDAVPFGPRDDLGYRRPPVTASFEDLRRRGLPEVLFVHSHLPEGVTICDVNMFAAMIQEAYLTPGTLHPHHTGPDEDGNDQYTGLGNNTPTSPRASPSAMSTGSPR
jgi:hypothetical protein